MKNGLTIDANGNKFWYLNDKLHRTDGPACEYFDGHKDWYLDGKQHRTDGPACEYVDGNKLWYFHGQELKVSSNEEFFRLLKLKAFW